MPQRRLYLDNAATSFPKAPGVAEAVRDYIERVGATPGRAAYAESRAGGRVLRRCRERICGLLNGQSPDHVVFTLNTTDALNLAIKGVIANRRRTRPGRRLHVVTSAMDHNSVLRPLNASAAEGVEWTCVDADPDGFVNPDDIERSINSNTALVVISHASNVTGAVQPAETIGRVCRRRDVCFLLDAAQSLGHVPVDAQALDANLVAFPGHKGLLGPLGTGGLYFRPGVESEVDTIREGGTGTDSEFDTQPVSMPDKYEPGSQNAPGIAGLAQATGWVLEHSASNNFAHERDLTAHMTDLLISRGVRHRSCVNGVEHAGPLARFRLLGPTDPARRIGVFSLVHDSATPDEVAAVLESSFGILARAGLHCAPRAHAALGTSHAGGALRLSLGPFLRVTDIDYVVDALCEIGASLETSTTG